MTKATNIRSLDASSYNEFVGRFHKETDRAAAVLAGGFLDAVVEAAIRSCLIPSTRLETMFVGQGALSSFGAKISLAAALGIITEPLARDMDLVRKVRNHFAHHIWDATFDSSPVSDWCTAIQIVDAGVGHEAASEPVESSSRIRYLFAVGMLTLMVATSPKVPDEFCERMTGIRAAT